MCVFIGYVPTHVIYGAIVSSVWTVHGLDSVTRSVYRSVFVVIELSIVRCSLGSCSSHADITPYIIRMHVQEVRTYNTA